MPDLPADNVEVEKIVRAGLVALFADIPGLPHVLTHRVYIDGEAEAVRRAGFKHPVTKQTEYRLLVIDLAAFDDTDAGCADNPVFNLDYTLQLSVSHMDARTDGSTSTDDYARILLTLRERVLKSQKSLGGYAQLKPAPLRQVSARFGIDPDETLIYGHHAQLTLRVEVTPSPASP
ncbi:MAG TPA: hypothetical protein VK422_18890 [Pyrinomonadaceae bacterium]|nr:hypothetical protein [Pyrinomonadaceae bacterium]